MCLVIGYFNMILVVWVMWVYSFPIRVTIAGVLILV